MNKIFIICIIIVNCTLINSVSAKNSDNTLRADQAQVIQWNNFVDELYQLHKDKIKGIKLSTEELIGGYGGGFSNNNFYREVSYFNKDTQQLISIIQWELSQPDKIHTIEVFLYDKKGRVKTDFYARFLPYARNAPVQTLINLHNYNDNLHAFRQFDASGVLIYETCRGKYFNETINLHLDDQEISEFRYSNSDEMLNEAYITCFSNVSQSATNYINPNKFITTKRKTSDIQLKIDYQLSTLNKKIKYNPKNVLLYIKRGELYFKLHDFGNSIADYNKAISLNNSIDQAYFGRGMSLARNGQIEQGINDLTIYISRNPNSSKAYTKRGVRYIWAGKLKLAKSDLIKAVKLDNSNSEAHDDLGVIYAQEKDLSKALKHFNLAIEHDATYQKAYHNQAMAYILTNSLQQALVSINKSLMLDSDSKNSLMLKSEILIALGENDEAKKIIDKAEFLPEGNWPEQLSIQ